MKKSLISGILLLASFNVFAAGKYAAYVNYITEENLAIKGDTASFVSLINPNKVQLQVVDTQTNKVIINENIADNPNLYSFDINSSNSITLKELSGKLTISGSANITKKLFTVYGVISTLPLPEYPVSSIDLVKARFTSLLGNENFELKDVTQSKELTVSCGQGAGKGTLRCSFGSMQIFVVEDKNVDANPTPTPTPTPTPAPGPISTEKKKFVVNYNVNRSFSKSDSSFDFSEDRIILQLDIFQIVNETSIVQLVKQTNQFQENKNFKFNFGSDTFNVVHDGQEIANGSFSTKKMFGGFVSRTSTNINTSEAAKNLDSEQIKQITSLPILNNASVSKIDFKTSLISCTSMKNSSSCIIVLNYSIELSN